MPAIQHKKKKKVDKAEVKNHRKVVSAYSEEGVERNISDAKREKKVRIAMLTLVIVLLVATIAGTILILHFAK